MTIHKFFYIFNLVNLVLLNNKSQLDQLVPSQITSIIFESRNFKILQIILIPNVDSGWGWSKIQDKPFWTISDQSHKKCTSNFHFFQHFSLFKFLIPSKALLVVMKTISSFEKSTLIIFKLISRLIFSSCLKFFFLLSF